MRAAVGGTFYTVDDDMHTSVLRDPTCYDPARSFERALSQYGAEVKEAVRALGSSVDIDGALAQLEGENQRR